MPMHTKTLAPQSIPRMRPTILTLTLLIAMGGCTAFEGVNVGANIPIGGIGGVGVNKTIGQGQNPAPQPPVQGDPPAPEETVESTEPAEEPSAG